MVIIDSSVWIAFFRGEKTIQAEINDLLEDQSVLMPIPIWVELLSGASKKDLPLLKDALSALPKVFPSRKTWKTLESWIALASKKGRRFGIVDLLVASLCVENEAALWSLDGDFDEMHHLKFVKLY